MIQFNLLPDVKLEYIKARRTKRIVSSVAVLVASAALVFTLFLGGLVLFQSKHLGDLNSDIKRDSKKITDTPNINKMLTVQNQLESLPGLHDSKPVVSRLFSYLSQITPNEVNLTNFDVDFTANTFEITGTADKLSSVNKFADILKFITYETDATEDEDAGTVAFSNVVLSSFSLDASTGRASYTIMLNYDTAIFDTAEKIKLTVPGADTRSVIQNPSALFTDSVNTGSEEQ